MIFKSEQLKCTNNISDYTPKNKSIENKSIENKSIKNICVL